MSGWVRYASFEKGQSFDLRVLHRGSNLDTPDFDWEADVRVPSGEPLAIYIDQTPFPGDSDYPLIGFHGPSDVDETRGNIARLYIPLVDLDLIDRDGNEIADEVETEQFGILAVNNDDDDNDGVVDNQDSRVPGGDNDLRELQLHRMTPTDLRGSFKLYFDETKVRVWRTRERTSEVITANRPDAAQHTRLTVDQDHTFYLEAIAPSAQAGDTSIKARFTPNDAAAFIVRGTHAEDEIKMTVVSANVTAYRPMMGMGTYTPFQKTPVAEIDETHPERGPGIRVNRDDDNGNYVIDAIEDGPVMGENDLLELVIDRPQIEALKSDYGDPAISPRCGRLGSLGWDVEFVGGLAGRPISAATSRRP